MNKRKRQILQAVVEDYLETAEPVGSRVIARRYHLEISPATIRNEMADLEEEGLLSHPHTSAGRIPTDRGYRFYIDHLMPRAAISSPEEEVIRSKLTRLGEDLEEMLQEALEILSLMSEYATFVVAPPVYQSVVKLIRVLHVDIQKILIFLLTTRGSSQLLVGLQDSLGDELGPEACEEISNLLTQQLMGKQLRELRKLDMKRLVGELPQYRTLLSEVNDALLRFVEANETHRVYAAGVANMMKQPEFNDAEKMRQLLDVLEEREQFAYVLGDVKDKPRSVVQIGSEIPTEKMQDFSIVSRTVGEEESHYGRVGIVGPTRMGYQRTMALVDVVGDILDELLSK